MMQTTNTNPALPTLSQARELGRAWLAANPAALEVEFAIRLGTQTMRVWVDRSGDAYDAPAERRK